jgi:hypothetical protein
VAACPTTLQPTPCLTDGVGCVSGTFTPTYASFGVAIYCIPNSINTNVNLQSIFGLNLDTFNTWIYDLNVGYGILLVAAAVAMVSSLIFFCMVR